MAEDRLILGCGYVGRRVAEAWGAAGHRVHVLTRSEGKAAEFASRGWQPVVGDVTRPETLAALPRAETVLYAVGYDRSAGASKRQVSVEGVAAAMQTLRGRIGRCLFISSTSVYGQMSGEEVDETSPSEPAYANGRVVLDSEHAFLAHAGDTGAVLRFAGIYGPGRLLASQQRLRSGEMLSGVGEHWLNLIHVEDGVHAILQAERHALPGETYLVCDDEPVRRKDFYGELARLLGAPPPRFDGEVRQGRGGTNKRCSNRLTKRKLQLDLRFPNYRSGLWQAIEAT